MGKVENLSRENLEKSYLNLEKAFTKKCQELKELEKEKARAVEDPAVVDENLTSGAEAEGEILAQVSGEVSSEEKIAEEVVGEEQNGVKNGEQSSNLRELAVQFLRENASAKAHCKEISKMLLTRPELLKHENPFEVAYGLVLIRESGKKKAEPVSQVVKEPVVDEVRLVVAESAPSLLGRMGGVSLREQPRKYSSFEDARGDLEKLFR